MIYIKSVLVGIVTLFVATVVYVVCAMLVFMSEYQPPPGGMIALSLPALLTRPLFLLIALAAFALGFYWEFRRLSS
jgi:hypothetical protein